MATPKPMVSGKSVGIYLGLADLVLAIVLPMIVFGVFIKTGRGVYVYPAVTVELVALVVLLTVWLYLLAPYVARLFMPVAGVFLALLPRLGRRMFGLFALLYLGSSVLFLLQGLSRNRYDDVRASENLGATAFVTVLFVCKTFVAAQVFYSLVTGRVHPRSGAYWLAVLAATALAIDGLAQTMLVGVIFAFVMFRGPFRAFLQAPIFRKPLSLLALGTMAAFLWVCGIAFKAGSVEETVASLRDREVIEQHVSWLVDRVSTLYFAAGHAVNTAVEDPSLNTRARAIVMNQFRFRLCVVMKDSNCSRFKDDYGSLSRFNFLNIRPEDIGKAGASAGVLGSIAYLLPLYWVPVVALLFYSAVAAVIDAAVGKVPFRPTLAALIVYGYLLRGLFLDPAGFLNPLSPPFIGLLSFMLASAQFYHLRGRRAPASPEDPARVRPAVPALDGA